MRKLILRTLLRVIWTLLKLLDVCINVLFKGRLETISDRASNKVRFM